MPVKPITPLRPTVPTPGPATGLAQATEPAPTTFTGPMGIPVPKSPNYLGIQAQFGPEMTRATTALERAGKELMAAKPPALEPLPQAPEAKLFDVNSMKIFLPALAAITLVAGIAAKDVQGAMAAFQGMTDGYLKGRKDIVADQWQRYQYHAQRALAVNQQRVQEYSLALEQRKSNFTVGQAMLAEVSRKYQDAVTLASLQNKSDLQATEVLQNQWIHVQDMGLKQKELEIAADTLGIQGRQLEESKRATDLENAYRQRLLTLGELELPLGAYNQKKGRPATTPVPPGEEQEFADFVILYKHGPGRGTQTNQELVGGVLSGGPGAPAAEGTAESLEQRIIRETGMYPKEPAGKGGQQPVTPYKGPKQKGPY